MKPSFDKFVLLPLTSCFIVCCEVDPETSSQFLKLQILKARIYKLLCISEVQWRESLVIFVSCGIGAAGYGDGVVAR